MTYDPATDFSECSRLVPERERRLRRAARRARRDLQQILPNGGGVERRRLHCERLHECTPLWVFTLSNCVHCVSWFARMPRARARKHTGNGLFSARRQRHHSGITQGRAGSTSIVHRGRLAAGRTTAFGATPARSGRRAVL